MLQKLKHLLVLSHHPGILQNVQKSALNEQLLKNWLCNFSRIDLNRNLCSMEVPRNEGEPQDLKQTNKRSSEDDKNLKRSDLFPKVDLSTQLFNGIEFRHLPILHIKVTKNNTITNITDYKGESLMIKSSGTEGFKNSRKGSNVAAHTVGLLLARKALKNKINTVRVIIKGVGAGRQGVLKGLEIGGLQMVSLTDWTNERRVQRPKKQRRL